MIAYGLSSRATLCSYTPPAGYIDLAAGLRRFRQWIGTASANIHRRRGRPHQSVSRNVAVVTATLRLKPSRDRTAPTNWERPRTRSQNSALPFVVAPNSWGPNLTHLLSSCDLETTRPRAAIRRLPKRSDRGPFTCIGRLMTLHSVEARYRVCLLKTGQ